ncbi:MAG TPA: type II toxin-antitoxin system VapC family toxin [Niabella sp.]|nr:type II toxin-antitoxin system VapC family toxin [Niabella sp.]
MEYYLIDSNIISGYFSALYSDKGMEIIANAINHTPNISVITKIEALSWISENKEKEAIVRSFVKDSIVIALSDEIVEECIKLRRNRKIKTPDAIIAATAIIHNYTLISCDKIFHAIPILKFINPKEI